jgi:lipopolysaccharide transport system ATP-binding protein
MSVVRFDRVSKRFTLHRERSRSFQELFLGLIHRQRRPAAEAFWALRDVSFAIEPGEMVGLIGSNGAGKSTVLKLISRIIEPTSGQIEVNGRVGALLELGTGFHPDLTGRENIHMNGSFVGFGRSEIERRMADIIDFSEMERFIDVPVKHYSSGMYVRLGFAIAIHFEPDLLLVDEVLVVGDQAFQHRCLDRVNQLKRQGVSILLVTHARDTVRELCDRAIWLDEGQVRAQGQAERVLEQYLTHVFLHDEEVLFATEPAGGPSPRSEVPRPSPSNWRWGSREAEIVRVQLLDGEGQERRVFRTGEPFTVRMHFLAKKRIEHPQFGLALYHSSGFHINGPNTVLSGFEIEGIDGPGSIDYVVDSLPLLEGSYLLSVSLYNHDGDSAYDHHHLAYAFRVRPGSVCVEEHGYILIPAVWRMDREGTGAR